jgi:2-succinyl-5-enolpyruvyl-6-hydroxy-3-cyclohexene-1-carboxylate synthase
MTALHWWYILRGAAVPYDVQFRTPKSEAEVREHIKQHWNTTNRQIVEVWPAPRKHESWEGW